MLEILQVIHSKGDHSDSLLIVLRGGVRVCMGDECLRLHGGMVKQIKKPNLQIKVEVSEVGKRMEVGFKWNRLWKCCLYLFVEGGHVFFGRYLQCVDPIGVDSKMQQLHRNWQKLFRKLDRSPVLVVWWWKPWVSYHGSYSMLAVWCTFWVRYGELFRGQYRQHFTWLKVVGSIQMTFLLLIKKTMWTAEPSSTQAITQLAVHIWAIYNDLSRRLVTPNGGKKVRESAQKWPKQSG